MCGRNVYACIQFKSKFSFILFSNFFFTGCLRHETMKMDGMRDQHFTSKTSFNTSQGFDNSK